MGALEVYYLEEKPEIDEGLFLKEERNLIEDIAIELAVFIKRKEEADKSLKESYSKLNSILSSIVDLVFVFDKQGRFTPFHVAGEELYTAPENFVGKRYTEVMPHHVSELLDTAIEKNKRGEATELEYWLEIDGETKWYSAKLSPMLLDGGFTGSVAVIRNITDRKRAEEEIKKLLKTIETAREAICTISPELIITYTNEAMDALFGYEKGELIGKHVSICNAGPTPIKTSKQIMGVLQKGGWWEGEILNQRKDGTKFISHARISLLKEKDARIVSYLSTQHDITEQKQVEQKLRDSEEGYRTIFETTGTAMNITEDNGIISLVNKEWENTYGYSKGEIEGKKRYIDLVHKSDLERVIGIFKSRTLNPDSAPRTYETQIVDKKGNVRDILATVSKIPGTRKRVVSGSDITSLKRTEKELRRSESRLRLLSQQAINAQEEERTRIARELHDELGQELTAIKIEAVSLAERLGNSSVGKRVWTLVNLADQLISTVHRISVNLRPEILDKLGLLKAMQWYAEDFERHTGISCPVDVEGQVIVNSKETATAAYRILQEALTNVLRHAKATQAEIRISKKGNKLVISVSDNGVGMDMSKLDDKSSLGLLGMRERAYVIGGTLRIRSRLGKGTKVTAYLPLLEIIHSSTAQ